MIRLIPYKSPYRTEGQPYGRGDTPSTGKSLVVTLPMEEMPEHWTDPRPTSYKFRATLRKPIYPEWKALANRMATVMANGFTDMERENIVFQQEHGRLEHRREAGVWLRRAQRGLSYDDFTPFYADKRQTLTTPKIAVVVSAANADPIDQFETGGMLGYALALAGEQCNFPTSLWFARALSYHLTDLARTYDRITYAYEVKRPDGSITDDIIRAMAGENFWDAVQSVGLSPKNGITMKTQVHPHLTAGQIADTPFSFCSSSGSQHGGDALEAIRHIHDANIIVGIGHFNHPQADFNAHSASKSWNADWMRRLYSDTGKILINIHPIEQIITGEIYEQANGVFRPVGTVKYDDPIAIVQQVLGAARALNGG